MANAEECKLLGNESVAAKSWEAAYNYYLKGVGLLRPSEGNLRVILTSNMSLVLLQLSRFQEALEEASKCMELDPKFEKGYLRYAAALEALNLKVADATLTDSCPVMKTYKKGLEINPGSTLIADAMKISFPFVNTSTVSRSSKSSCKTKSSKANKKQLSGTAKAEREACVSLDIRGATGQHELRVNGRYDPTDELSGGWPIYRKRIEIIPGENDEVDEDDNLILEFHSGLDEWMVKHVSSKGSHRSFVFLKCSPPTRPELCRSSSWQSMEDKKLTNQSSMSVLTIDQRHDEDVAFFKRERDSCLTVEVRGALGRKALGINGIFEPTEDCCGGWPVYRKIADLDSDVDAAKAKLTADRALKDDYNANSSTPPTISSPSSSSSSPQNASVWMEYNPYFRSWQVKPTPCLGTNRSWGYSNTNTMHGTLPQLSRGVWEVLEDEDFRPQESICLMTLTQWQIEDEKLAQLWSSSCSIDVRGATGTYGPIVNGVYDPMTTFVAGYQKRTDPKCVIEYSRMRKLWQLKCSQGPCAFVPDDSRSLPELCSAVWYVMVNGNWERQATVKVSSLSSRKALDNEMYGDKLPDAMPLDVRGATGVNAFKINGVYEPIDEFSGGWPVYQRKGGVDYWLEYNEERGNWQIKSASHRGMDSAFAYVDSFPSKYPQKCEGTWWVYTGVRGANSNSGWEMQQSVTILSVLDRTVEDMKSYEKRKSHCVPLDIRGATGPRGGGLNGVFDPTDEMRGGWPVYLKRDDGEWWLEYDACPQKWMIRPTACRGTTRGRAYILCDPHTRPERAKGVWRLSDGKGGWAPEPTVQVVSEADAVSQDKILFDGRRAVAVDIAIRGAVKPVGHINGIYEPTDESWHAWPIYKKKGCDTHYLEYHAPSSSWQVKPATVRGTKRCWAYVHSENEHPELSSKSWLVIINGEHAKQDSIAITTLLEQTQNDKILGNIRRKSCNPIKVRGATGKHAAVINGVYEPSPTELCGGWPVYYNNTSIKGSEEKKGVKGKEVDGDVTKSFLLFCPYAMSWAITVLASVNDPCGENGEIRTIVSDGGVVLIPATRTGEDFIEKSTRRVLHAEFSPSKATLEQMRLAALKIPPPPPAPLPFYSPSSSPLTLAFFEVATNTQPELAHGSATWKVLCGSQFEPQLSIKVSVVADSGVPLAAAVPAVKVPFPVAQKIIPKQKIAVVTAPIKSKDSSGAKVNSSSSGSSSSVSGLSQINLSQIGVKTLSHEYKKHLHDVSDGPVTSPLTAGSLSPPPEASKTPGVKDSKKSSWQNRGIGISLPDSLPMHTLGSVKAGLSSPGVKTPLTPLKAMVMDSNSDDGVGVSNSEVEDEWLEVKQKRAKGTNTFNGMRGGPHATSTSSSSSSTLKESRSRSSSPVTTASGTGTGPGPGPESFAAAVANNSEKKQALKDDPIMDFPPVPSGLCPTPSVTLPAPLSTMGFKAAVMSGQQETPSPYSHSTSQPHTQSALQSFSALDFPAMPSSSSSNSQRNTTAAIPPPQLTPPPLPTLTPISPAPASIPTPVSIPVPAPIDVTPVTVTAAVTSDPVSAPAEPVPAGTTTTNKKQSKSKKKAAKSETESTLETSREPMIQATLPTPVPAVAAASPSIRVPDDVSKSEKPPAPAAADISLHSSIYNELPVLYQIPPLTSQGSYAAHITQGAYDMHNTHDTHLRPSTPPHSHSQHNSHSHHTHISSDHEYLYHQHPAGDEENYDDLFKAISSANAIDFDPSFTANNLARTVSSTLSPLSRRIGSRNDLDALNAGHESMSSLSRPANGSGMHTSYGSSLLNPPGHASPTPLANAEGFLSGISFDFFSSLLHSTVPDVGQCLLRKEGSILENLPHLSTDIPIAMHLHYPVSSLDPNSPLDALKLQELSPLCSEYQYRGPLIHDLSDDNYPEPDSHSIRYQMPTLIPIPPSELTPVTPFNSVDMLSSSLLNHYSKSGISDLPQNLPHTHTHTTPQLLTAKELCVATDNFSTNHLMNATQISVINDINARSHRIKPLTAKEKDREKEMESSVCTFIGMLRHHDVVIRIVTPNPDVDVDTTLQSRFLRELRVLSEVSHANVLPLYGYTFRPYARAYKIPLGSSSLNSAYNPDTYCPGKYPLSGFFYLHSALVSPERRQRFSWRVRIRVVQCILRALSYLHEGDKEEGRCPIAHSNIHVGNVILENLDGDAYLTDFSMSTDLSPHLNSTDGSCDGVEGDIVSTGIILLQLLVGQSESNHSHVVKARSFFKVEGSINDKISSQPNNGNRKLRRKNYSSTTLNSTQLEDVISLAESEVWPVPVIHRIVETLTMFFSNSSIDPSGDNVKRGKCDQLLLMLDRIST